MKTSHELMGGKLHVYKRENSSTWQCATYFNGRNYRVSTKEDGLSKAKEFAEDWYLELKSKKINGLLKSGKTFKMAAERFIDEFETITAGQRSPVYIKGHKDRIRLHLNPFFGLKYLSEITSGLVQDYRIARMKSEKPPARSTLHQEIVCLRQILACAERHRWIDAMPNMKSPFKQSYKISHRAWFSPAEYKQLYQATRERAQKPKKERWRKECEDLHDFVLFMVNTGLRPDEALNLELRDVAIVTDEATGERILEIEVRGKRGTGYCKSMPGAVHPFKRYIERNKIKKPTDPLFPKLQRELFNTILDELGLKKDREGNARTFYSLRHTYICLRLMEGADIYQIAKNCRTSVEMIEKFYASHLKNTLDTAAINVMKPKAPKRTTIEEYPRRKLRPTKRKK